LLEVARRIGGPVRALLRRRGTPFAELGLDDPAKSEDELLDAIALHPILIERPVVIAAKGVAICRPPETVLTLL
jgi:arsenate reductase